MRRINHTHPRRGIARTVVTLAVIVSAFATAFVSSAQADAILYGTSGTPGSVGDLTASCSPGVVTALAPDIGAFAPRIGSGTATAHTRTTSTSSDRTSSGSRSERSSSGSTVPVGHTFGPATGRAPRSQKSTPQLWVRHSGGRTRAPAGCGGVPRSSATCAQTSGMAFATTSGGTPRRTRRAIHTRSPSTRIPARTKAHSAQRL